MGTPMKAKVTKILKLDKLDSFGNTSFIIEFDEGTKGFYTSKNADQNKFIVGNVADFELEVKQGSKGPYNKITAPNAGQQFKGGGKPSVDPKTQMIGFTAAYVKDLIVADKVKLEDFEKQFNRIYSFLITKIV
jgi:hypothetical protein